jgi:hypothetical protein
MKFVMIFGTLKPHIVVPLPSCPPADQDQAGLPAPTAHFGGGGNASSRRLMLWKAVASVAKSRSSADE